MSESKVIVFGNAHPNTLGLVRSLGEKGIRPILLLEPCDLKFCCVRFSKYIAKIHYLKSVGDGLNVLRNEYCGEAKKPIILVAGDPAMCLLDTHYAELKDHFHIFNARGEQGRINFFMNKSAQFPIAEKCGLNTIKTWRIKDGAKIPDDVTYPCLMKGNNSTSSSKTDIHVCRNRKELEVHLVEVSDCLIQKYIEKDFEIDITGFAYNQGRNVFIPAVVRKIRERITRQSDYIRLDAVDKYPTLELDKIKALVSEIGYEGIFSVEMLSWNGKFYFLEINLRNDGVGYLYTAAGINYPYMWVQYNHNERVDEAEVTNKMDVPRTLMALWDVDNLIKGRVRFVQWLREWMYANTHFVLNWDDMKPFVFFMYVLIRHFLKKHFRFCMGHINIGFL